MIFGDKTSPEIGRLAPRCIALLPIAALEQHGNHLPVITDAALGTEITQRAEAALPDQVMLLPTFWVGSSHHHRDFPGTVSLQSETYIRVLEDLAENLLLSGFRKVVLFNSHGGNVTPMNEALYRVSLRHTGDDDPWVVGTSLWRLAEGIPKPFMEAPKITHACEYETSMMLALRADWVHMAKAQGSEPVRGSAYYDPLGYTVSRVTTCETFVRMTATGALGKPGKATAEKGHQLLSLYSDALVNFLREFSTWAHDTGAGVTERF